MSTIELLTLVALLAGPAVAVLIAEWIQRRRQAHDRRETLMRQLLISRSTPADPAYQMAVNMIPVEFSRYDAVKVAWDKYIDIANKAGGAPEGSEKERLGRLTVENQAELIKQVMLAMNYKEREAGPHPPWWLSLDRFCQSRCSN